MTIPEDFKTRLKIAKSKIKKQLVNDDGKRGSFINGPNFTKFFEIFEIESFITIGNATEEFKQFASDNGFTIEYRKSIGGYVRR